MEGDTQGGMCDGMKECRLITTEEMDELTTQQGGEEHTHDATRRRRRC